MNLLIEFEDMGQAFSWWLLDKSGRVIATDHIGCPLWIGLQVLNHSTVNEGEKVRVRSYGSKCVVVPRCRVKSLKYNEDEPR